MAEAAQRPHPSPPKRHRRWWLWALLIVVLAVVLIVGIPWLQKSLATVSTDDAYVNGHVTFVAPRVPGQVARVLVDDDNRVHKGDVLMELDPRPLQVQVNIAQAKVDAAESDLLVATAQTRAAEAQTRSMRFALEKAVEDVKNQTSLLGAKVAALKSQQATLDKAQADYARAAPLVSEGAVTKEEVDRRKEALEVAQAGVEEALQDVYQVRVSLGLSPQPGPGEDLASVPADIDQSFSAVRQAQFALFQSAAQLGVNQSFDMTPAEMIKNFYKRDPGGDIDKIYAQILKTAPLIGQAQAKLDEARRDLDQAKLNLSYCTVVAEIDGVVTRRNVNPGNNVVAGQSVMAIRSLTDIWVDANFKETQLAGLRIGLPVDLDVDVYGSRHLFKGRISGFTMGTGSTLALLPAENATGNFVKVVQRLPVRIDLVDYDPEKDPLFIGLSVTPTVYLNEVPTGPNAGKVFQPYASLPMAATTGPASPVVPAVTGSVQGMPSLAAPGPGQ